MNSRKALNRSVMKKADREKIFNKYDGCCAYCGCNLEKGWHADHIDPIRRTQTHVRDEKGKIVRDEYWKPVTVLTIMHPELDTIENHNPSCRSCNINKHSMSIEQFRAAIAGYLNSLNLRIVQYKMVKKYNLVQETGITVEFYFEKFERELAESSRQTA